VPIAKLTKRVIDDLQPQAGRVTFYDSELTGFCVTVHPTGAKRWCVEYRPGAGGRSVAKRRMVLGSTDILTPDEARTAARNALASAQLGGDPGAARIKAREMPSFKDFAERYLTEEATVKLKPKTIGNYKIYLRKHAVPIIGGIKLDKLDSSDVARTHRKIGEKTPTTANRLVECIASVYRFAAQCGLVKRGSNPTAGITAFREQRHERYLTSEELARLGDAIREAETTGVPWLVDETKPTAKHIPKKNQLTHIDPHAAAALRLLILTGARLREILHLRWEEVDIERGLLLLPDSKTGRKTIVLNAPALAVLAKLKRTDGYVIKSDDPDQPRHDLNRPWRLVVKRAGLDGVRLHDLRHTHASYGAALGLGLPIIGKLLGHTQASTTERYAHLAADPLRRASDRIGKKLVRAMGDFSGPTATVVPLSRTRR
jgi:integrase